MREPIRSFLRRRGSRSSAYGIVAALWLATPGGAVPTPSDSLPEPRRPVVGIALSGGGARGLAHIGVLLALEEEGIPVDRIAGTSMGSIVGGFSAAGWSAAEIESLATAIDWEGIFSQEPTPNAEHVGRFYDLPESLVRLRLGRGGAVIAYGLINAQRISETLFRYTAAASYAARSDFDSLAVPFRALALELAGGELRALRAGELAQAMRASMAIPLVFYPARIDGRLMIDGGLLNVLPADVVRDLGADIILGVDVEEFSRLEEDPRGLIEITTQAIGIMIRELKAQHADPADLVIEPALGDHSTLDFSDVDGLVRAGYEAAQARMEEIRALLPDGWESWRPKRRALDRDALTDARVRSVSLEGTENVSPSVVRALFPLDPGERFDLDAALRGVERIFATGLFENVWLGLAHADPGVAITVHVLERDAHTAAIGAHYRSESGFSGFVQATFLDLLGLQERTVALVRLGRMRSRVTAALLRELPAPVALTTRIDAGYEEEQPYLYGANDRFTQPRFERANASVNLAALPGTRGLLSVGVLAERVWVDRGRSLATPHDPADRLFATLELGWDSRAPAAARRASAVRIGVDGRTAVAGGSRGYSLVESRASGSHPLPWRQSVGFLAGTGVSDGPPATDLFRIGGPHELPGLHREELWTPQFLTLGLLHNLWITDDLRTEVYAATAAAWTDPDRLGSARFTKGIGLGLVLSTPVGPAAARYGWSELGEREAYLSVGFEF